MSAAQAAVLMPAAAAAARKDFTLTICFVLFSNEAKVHRKSLRGS
jgi:hypothetical protein